MKHLQIFFRYLHYLRSAQSPSGIQNQFVSDLIERVLNATEHPYMDYTEIEKRRKVLLKSKNREIQITDLGAGSHLNNKKTKKISTIAKNAAKPASIGQLLFRIVYHFHPEHIIELGTSLGISTMYLTTPWKNTPVDTFEGCPETANVAKGIFQKYPLKSIKMHIGNFDDTLPNFLKKTPKVHFAFVDGNHRKEPTIRYFNWLKEKCNDQSILIFDDIHWSEEMEEAWNTICQDPSVTVSIDLFYIGLVFFRKDQQQQHFVLKPKL